MGIFTRFELSHPQKVILQEGVIKDGKIIQDERFYLQATIRIGKDSMRIGTTHLPFHPTFRTTPNKLRMVDTILSQMSLDQPTIFAGDLNTTPRTKAASTFRKHGLKNAGPALHTPTWTTKPFGIGPWSYDTLHWRLDYVLHTNQLKVLSSRIVPTDLSDHLPILTEFEVAG